jgi:hypothetical protein
MTKPLAILHNIYKNIILTITLFFSILGMINFDFIQVNAQGLSNNPKCTASDLDNFSNIMNPANFFPLVPAECAIDEDGKAIPLSLELVPVFLLRGYGAISSLVIYIGGILIIVSGLQYILSAGNSSQIRKSIDRLITVATSIIIVLLAYTIVNTIVIMLGLGNYANMSVADFFVD